MAYNVRIPVADPDALIAGDSPFAGFDAVYVQLYKWTSESAARTGTAGAGTLVTTWTLIASTEQATENAGPFSFAYDDTTQAVGEWYRYRFADTGLAQFSSFSEPWPARRPTGATLREIIYQVGVVLGEAIERGNASAGSATSITCTPVFQSTLRQNNFWKGHWVLITQDAGGAGAAPEGQEALIASDVASTGVVTLDRTLTAAVASGDEFIVSAYMRPSEMIRCINRAREGMKALRTTDYAQYSTEDRYLAPVGVKAKTDLYSIAGIQDLGTDTNTIAEGDVLHETWEEDGQVYFRVPAGDYAGYPILRLTYEVSYADLEGDLEDMGDTTYAPLAWLRYAAADECMEILTRDDSENGEFASVAMKIKNQLAIETGRYAPKMPARRAKKLNKRLPGPRRY